MEVVEGELAHPRRPADDACRTEHRADRRQVLGGVGLADRPPSVPRLRTTGSAMTFSASRKIGKMPASSSDSSSRRWRTRAPMRTTSGSTVMWSSSSPRSLMSIRYSGFASLSFIIGRRLCPPATTRAPSPCRSSNSTACSTPVARAYSNGPGTCMKNSHPRADASVVPRRSVRTSPFGAQVSPEPRSVGRNGRSGPDPHVRGGEWRADRPRQELSAARADSVEGADRPTRREHHAYPWT